MTNSNHLNLKKLMYPYLVLDLCHDISIIIFACIHVRIAEKVQ